MRIFKTSILFIVLLLTSLSFRANSKTDCDNLKEKFNNVLLAKKSIKYDLSSIKIVEEFESCLRKSGDTNDELEISILHKKDFLLYPVFKTKNFLKSAKKAFLEEKIIDEKDESYFLIKLFKSKSNNDQFKYFLLKSKVGGVMFTEESFPIVEVYELESVEQLVNIGTNFKNFKLLDLAYVKPYES